MHYFEVCYLRLAGGSMLAAVETVANAGGDTDGIPDKRGAGGRLSPGGDHFRPAASWRPSEADGDRPGTQNQHHAGARSAQTARGRRLSVERLLSWRDGGALRCRSLDGNPEAQDHTRNPAGR